MLATIFSRRRHLLLLEQLHHLRTTTTSAERTVSNDPSSTFSPTPYQSRIHLDIQHRLKSPGDEESYTALIARYAKARMPSHARQLFDEFIPNPTSTSFNALLTAHFKSNEPHLVPNLFASLPKSHPSIFPDRHSYSLLIRSLCLSGDPESALQYFLEMKARNFEPERVDYTALIKSFYKKDKPAEARSLWDEMAGPAGIKPELGAYRAKAMHAAVNGTPEEVLKVIESSAANEEKNGISYKYMIVCYCRNGRFEEAREFMKGRIKPARTVIDTMVKLMCENGDFDGALEVCREGMEVSRLPFRGTLRVLAEGLVERGKLEERKELVRDVKERFGKVVVDDQWLLDLWLKARGKKA